MALSHDDRSQPQFSWAGNTWDIIDTYFKDNPEVHITHQLESYNTMIESLVPAMIQRNMPIKAYTTGGDGGAKNTISMRVLRVGVSKPVQYVDRQYRPMTPDTARKLNLSYSAPMYLDLEITSEKGGIIETHIEERVHLCKLPIMVGSKYCHLYGLNDKQLAAMNECPMDRGGYFIVNGGEKVIISQERPVENSITVFPENDENKPYVARAEVKSTIDQRFFPIKTTIVRLTRQPGSSRTGAAAKKQLLGQRLLVFLPYGEQPVPLFILFKALGVMTDREIMAYLTDDKDADIVSLLVPSAYDGQQVSTHAEALAYVAGCLKIRLDGAPGSPEELQAMRLRYAQDILDREFLPHTGNNITKKLRFLSLMVNNLLQAYLNPALYTDRDKLTNKRLDLPGTLLGQIFRYWWQRLVKDIKVQFVKDLKTPGVPGTIITLGQSVRRIIQKCGIENKLKYALSTGNWVTTRTHATSASKKGISQVLQRLSYLGTLSHKRRIMSPLERAGSKHEPPRRYHGTQPPKICPNETPEGAQVGTVKNLSLMTHVTIETSARPVIYCLEQLGMIPIEAASSSAVHACVKILVNGDFVGLAPPGLRATMEMYRTLRCLKLSGRISKFASIAWHQDFRLIIIYTDGGRYSHPYYTVDEDNHFQLDRLLKYYDGDAKAMLKAHGYTSLCARLTVLEEEREESGERGGERCREAAIKELAEVQAKKDEGLRTLNGSYKVPGRYSGMAVIEYLDTNEEETAMIAVMPDELYDARTYRQGRDGHYYGNLTRQLELAEDAHDGTDITAAVMAQLPEDVRAMLGPFIRGVILLRRRERKVKLVIVPDADGRPIPLPAAVAIGNMNRFLSGMYITHTHCMLHPALINGVVATNIPFSDHNQSPRNCYQSSMGKQAIGMFSTNYNSRMDTMASVMIYPQRPVVATRTAMYTGMSKLYHGYMSMHGIACISGYNQEDSLLSNGDSAKRGAFDICFYRTYINKLQKLSSTDAGGERFDIPPERTIGRKAGSATEDRYHAINRHTSSRRPKLPYVGAVVGPGDILIPKYRSLAGKKDRGTDVLYADSSTTVRATESGMVDLLMPSEEMTHYEDEDGYQIAKVRICELRMEEIGDKFASRSAQKGTVGMHYNSADMIFSQDGTSPDKVMNAQAIPSRMTIGQLIEALASKEGILRGRFHDATPFTEFNVDEIKENIEEMGYDCCGDEIMYNGLTGEVMDVPIFFNPTYYQRLKHMVADKMHARNLGPIQALTKQPAEGRSRAGGLRLGEMERDCMIAHGAASVLKEKLVDSSDIFEVFISKQRKTIIAANPQLGVFQQGTRDIYGTDDIYKLHIPYALNLFRNELRAAMVDMQMEIE